MALEQEFLNYARDDGGNVSVPRRLRTRRNAPDVDLAYVTPEEQGILASLRPGTPHRGPMGIPNYDAFDVGGGYRGSEERDYGRQPSGQRATTAFTGASETGRGLAEAGMSSDPALNRMYGFPGPKRTGQGGQGFFSRIPSFLGQGIGAIGNWARNLRMVDGQMMPQSYFSEEEREKRRNLKSINTILNRDAPITALTQKRLNQIGYQGEMPAIDQVPSMMNKNKLGLYTDTIPAATGFLTKKEPKATTDLTDAQLADKERWANWTPNESQQNIIDRNKAYASLIGQPSVSSEDIGDFTQTDIWQDKIGGTNIGDFKEATSPIGGSNVGSIYDYMDFLGGSAGDVMGPAGMIDPIRKDFNLEKWNVNSPYSMWLRNQNPLAQGGRVGYKTGGRVGILSVF